VGAPRLDWPDIESAIRRATKESLGSRVLREPLLHFAVAGLILFMAASAWRAHTDPLRIEVTPQRVAELAAKYQQQFGEPPGPEQLEPLIRGYVEEEALYREGRARGLDRDDEIVRRRIAQKVEFLAQDRALAAQPNERQLADYYARHTAAYRQPARTSFDHLYFGGQGAEVRARAALSRLQAGAAPGSVGADAFPDLNSYAAMSATEAARVFGATGLAAALDHAPVGAWAGPYPSAYGWHLVRASGRTDGRLPPLAEVRERVAEDALRDAQAQANAAAIRRIVERYRVVRTDRGGRP
jgi:hypothetical protein